MNVVPVAIIHFFQFVYQEVKYVEPVANPHMGSSPTAYSIHNFRQNLMPTERLFSRGRRVRITCVGASDTMQAHSCFTTKHTLALLADMAKSNAYSNEACNVSSALQGHK
jgi:hypothetical protein